METQPRKMKSNKLKRFKNEMENLGRIFNPLNYSRHHHLQTHASNPTVYKIDNKKVRVFYSGRDKKNRSS